jgi:hypothetical protein
MEKDNKEIRLYADKDDRPAVMLKNFMDIALHPKGIENLEPGTMLVVYDGRGRVTGFESSPGLEANFYDYINKRVFETSTSNKVPHESMEFHFMLDRPDMGKVTGSELSARIADMEKEGLVAATQSARLTEAVYCIENGIDPLAPHVQAGLLQHDPKYNVWETLNDTGKRQAFMGWTQDTKDTFLRQLQSGKTARFGLKELPKIGLPEEFVGKMKNEQKPEQKTDTAQKKHKR